VNEHEAFKRSVGLVVAMEHHTGDEESRKEWQEAFDVLVGDLLPSDYLDLIMTMTGLILGLIKTICDQSPHFSNYEAEDYLSLLGQVVAQDEDNDQGTLFDKEE